MSGGRGRNLFRGFLTFSQFGKLPLHYGEFPPHYVKSPLLQYVGNLHPPPLHNANHFHHRPSLQRVGNLHPPPLQHIRNPSHHLPPLISTLALQPPLASFPFLPDAAHIPPSFFYNSQIPTKSCDFLWTCYSCSTSCSKRQQLRLFSGTSHGSYGASIYGGDRSDIASNSRLVELPKSEEGDLLMPNRRYKRMENMKWPGVVHQFCRKEFIGPSSRRFPATCVNFFHMRIPAKSSGFNPSSHCSVEGSPRTHTHADLAGKDGEKSSSEAAHILNLCLLSSPKPSLIDNPRIENSLFERTRGFVTQIVLNGRGVKAYYEPAWPHLHIRLGIGSKPIDVTRALQIHSKYVNVRLNSQGTLITIHGIDKAKVGQTAYRIYHIVKANPYTLKGGHFAMEKVISKAVKKK